MIITDIHAGMGNQMFMYAAGLAAASRLNTELRLGLWNFNIYPSESRPYRLDCFPEITERPATFSDLWRIYPSLALMNAVAYKPIIEFRQIKDGTYLVGYWEAEKYFADIAGLVRRKFTFSSECFDPKLYLKIRQCNSVALHVRRGDKVDNPGFYASDEHYLKASAEKITSLTGTPTFFVFSDDIEWCRESLPKLHEAEYVFVEGQTPAQDMALMTICKHIIMGPSTFSWWGAWLNDNPRKVVITPDVSIWSKSSIPDDVRRQRLFPDSWIKIA